MKYFKFFIIFCIITTLIFGFALKPRTAKAVAGVEDTSHDIILEIQNTMKQFLKDLPVDLNTVAKFIVKAAVDRLRENVMRWAQGGFRDDNQPFAITQWSDFFKQAVNLGSSKFLQEINATALCAPIRVSLGTMMGLDNPMMAAGISYPQYAACSLQNVVDNVTEFYKNPSIGTYGWDTWTALMQPQNNVLGSYLMAQGLKAEYQQAEKEAAQAQAQANNGYKNDAVCSQTDQDKCMATCDQAKCENECQLEYDVCMATAGAESTCDARYQGCYSGCSCVKKCKKASVGVCLNQTVKNVGSTVSAEISKSLGSDMDWLINVQEMDQLVQVLFSALTNKVVNGIGSIFTPSANSSTNNSSSSDTSNPSLFFANLKKSLTPQKEQELNSSVLSSTLQIIKGINRSTITCDKSSAQYIDVIEQGYAEIVDQQSQSLYVNNQTVDLKPDFEVLDPLFAPATVYGYSWDVVPWKKYPTKCTDLLTSKEVGKTFDSTCADIKSGLPPISRDKNCECLFSPDGLTCPPEPYPPFQKDFNTASAENKLIIGQKQDFYNSCTATYGDVTQRCSECLKKSEQQCDGKETLADKTSCINDVCNNYGDISGVKSGQDFYNKCSIEAQKANCYSCLKNYFMPDSYCGQVGEYVARATIKYPGTFRMKTPWSTPDVVSWIGRLEEGTCDQMPNSMPNDTTPVARICRILPDYKFQGQDLCGAVCPFTQNFTKQQLYNINDDKPNDADCNYQEVPLAAYSGMSVVEKGLLLTKGKCCKSFNLDPTNYAKCIGADGISTPTPPDDQGVCGPGSPEYCCAEGWRPVVLTRTGYTDAGYNPWGGDCSAPASFTLDNNYKYFMHLNNGTTTTDVAFIANGTCSETDENLNNTDQQPLSNPLWGGDQGDNEPDDPPSPTDATAPAGVVWSWNTPTSGGEQRCITGVPNGNYNAGVYHDDNQDTVSGIQICEKCDPNDANYNNGYYDTTLDQCNNKKYELAVPAGCE